MAVRGTTLALVVIVFSLVTFITIAPVLKWTQLRSFAANSPGPPEVPGITLPTTGLPPITTRRPNPEVQLIAHRGAANLAPENTIPALEAAIELGAQYIELDIRLTADGVPVLLHDYRVDRTTDGSGRLNELSLDQVRRLDAGSWFGTEYADTRIPTLEEALATLQGRACILWDTKDEPAKESVRLFRQFGFDGNCLLITFSGFGTRDDTDSARRLVELWPDAPLLVRARNTTELARILQDYPQTRAVFVPFKYIQPEFVDEVHAAGLKVIAKALDQSDNEQYYAALTAAGVDGILLSNLRLMQTYRKSLDTGLEP